MQNSIPRNAFVNAGATIVYIMVISSFMFYGQELFGPGEDVVLMPILMLSLLVFSAALVGILIFGRPIIWYLDGRKKEAVQLLAYTLGIFVFMILIVFLALFLVL